MKALQVDDLCVRYGGMQAVRGISFSLEAGQVVTLIGANGAGKTSTLNAISGLVPTSGGTVYYRGDDITARPAHEIARAGLVQVPEGRRVIAPLSVKENLQSGARTLPRERRGNITLESIYERFPRLSERREQPAGLLSGGEQQMLALGRAMLMNPIVLMLDEPSMGLAPLIVDDVYAMIRQIKAQGISILLVEQNAAQALDIADHALILEQGVITHEGSAAELRDDPTIVNAYLGS